MKKIISIALVLVLCLSMLVACGKNDDKKGDDANKNEGGSTTTTVAGGDNNNVNDESGDNNSETGLADAKAFLIAQYQKGDAKEPMVIKEDKDVFASAMGYAIAWSVSVSEGDANAVKISESDKENTMIIDIADSITGAVTFTATATISDDAGNSDTATFLFTIPGPVADPKADSTLTIKEAIELGASKTHNSYTSGKYYVTGTVVEVTSTEYGNMKIKDSEGNALTIYGSYGPDGTSISFKELNPQPKSGDKVKLYGIIGQYNDAPQMKNGWIKEINGKKPGKAPTTTRPSSGIKEPAANSNVSVADAIAIGLSKEHNTYTTSKYYVTGTVTEVYNEQYGNMKIKDDKGNILTIYGSYSADGKYPFPDLKTPPKAGDKVKIYGVIGQFGEVAQIKNGWIMEINGKKPEISSSAAVIPNTTLVSKPEVGVAYKFGLDQTKKGSVYYFTGVMSGFYGATDTNAAKAVDVYLENADGGYKIYFKDATGAKKYIKLEQSGTHYNFTFGAEGSVFTYDTERNAFSAPCGDQICYMGTYGDYVTVGCLTTEKLKDSDYIARFYAVED